MSKICFCLHETREQRDFRAASWSCGGEKLTLVVDEAVGGEQFEGVDLEQDSVEQKVVSCGTELGFVTQTRLCELLQRANNTTRPTRYMSAMQWGLK